MNPAKTFALIFGLMIILVAPALSLGCTCDGAGMACESDCGWDVCDQAVVAVEALDHPPVSDLVRETPLSREPDAPVFSIDRPPKLFF